MTAHVKLTPGQVSRQKKRRGEGRGEKRLRAADRGVEARGGLLWMSQSTEDFRSFKTPVKPTCTVGVCLPFAVLASSVAA